MINLFIVVTDCTACGWRGIHVITKHTQLGHYILSWCIYIHSQVWWNWHKVQIITHSCISHYIILLPHWNRGKFDKKDQASIFFNENVWIKKCLKLLPGLQSLKSYHWYRKGLLDNLGAKSVLEAMASSNYHAYNLLSVSVRQYL